MLFINICRKYKVFQKLTHCKDIAQVNVGAVWGTFVLVRVCWIKFRELLFFWAFLIWIFRCVFWSFLSSFFIFGWSTFLPSHIRLTCQLWVFSIFCICSLTFIWWSNSFNNFSWLKFCNYFNSLDTSSCKQLFKTHINIWNFLW